MQCRRKCAKTIGDRMSKLFPSVNMDFIISIIFNHISWVTLLSQMDESVIKCCIWQLHIPHPIMFQKVKKCSPCQVVHIGPHQDRYIIAECSDMVDLFPSIPIQYVLNVDHIDTISNFWLWQYISIHFHWQMGTKSLSPPTATTSKVQPLPTYKFGQQTSAQTTHCL